MPAVGEVLVGAGDELMLEFDEHAALLQIDSYRPDADKGAFWEAFDLIEAAQFESYPV